MAWLDRDRPSERIAELIESGDLGTAWDLILALVDSAPDDGALAFVAAGPLERFLSASTDESEALVRASIRRSPRLSRALAMVW